MCITACLPLKETILLMGMVIPMMFPLGLYIDFDQFKDQHHDLCWRQHHRHLSYEN